MCQMTVGKTKKADLIICNHLAVKSSIVTIANSKLAPRYKEGLLMGFVDGTHNYRIWDTKSNSVTTSRDVVFTHHSPTTSDIAPVVPEIVQVPDDDIITSGCEVKGLLQLEPIPAFIPDDKVIHS